MHACGTRTQNAGDTGSKLELNVAYDPVKNPCYDNYKAIDVSKVKEIPYDYDGLMGVPISFIKKWNPFQFDIVDIVRPIIGGQAKFTRIIIRAKR